MHGQRHSSRLVHHLQQRKPVDRPAFSGKPEPMDLMLLWDMAEAKSHSYWYFFMLVVLGMSGYIFSSGESVGNLEKWAAILCFTTFSGVNFIMNYKVCRLLDRVRIELDIAAGPGSVAVQKELAKSIGSHRALWTASVYFWSNVMVVGAIIFYW